MEVNVIDILPTEIVESILVKLDVASIIAVSCTCVFLKECASRALSFISDFDIEDIPLSIEWLVPLLPPNPHSQSLKADCTRLDDSAIDFILRPSLRVLRLHNCRDFSGRLLSHIGARCRDIRCLYLGQLADGDGHTVNMSDLEDLFRGCSMLESLTLNLDFTELLPDMSAHVWKLASERLLHLDIEDISSTMMSTILRPTRQTILPNIQKLCVTVDFITDSLIGVLSGCLLHLTHLDLEDIPSAVPDSISDLSNSGLQLINPNGRLKYLSLNRRSGYFTTYFRRVDDVGITLMADRSSKMESISLGGFCRVTYAGYRTLLCSCPNLRNLRIIHGSKLTDLSFHGISTSLFLTSLSMRWCNFVTSYTLYCVGKSKGLKVLDLRDSRNLGDEAMKTIRFLHKLKILLLDGCDISDTGFTYLGQEVLDSLISLSVRRCERLTDKFIGLLFDGSGRAIQKLDFSYLPNVTDNGILLLALARVPVIELSLRSCDCISDTSVMALAAMQVEEGGWDGSCLRVLDLYGCQNITGIVFEWFYRPYFPRLRSLGLTGRGNEIHIEALSRSRSSLRVVSSGLEIAMSMNDSGGLYRNDYHEVDDLEEWLLEDDGEDLLDDEDEDFQ